MEKPSKHVNIIQHHPAEGLGTIADALKRAAIAPHYIRAFDGQPVPKEIGDAAGLIVMGGPQSVYEQDKFPFLLDEMRPIEDALKHARPILGVCLGSQLLAAALGATVCPVRQKEIGGHRIALTRFATGGAGALPAIRYSQGNPVPSPLSTGMATSLIFLAAQRCWLPPP